MDFHSVMETFAEAWVAANTHTPLTVAAEQGLINGPTHHTPPNRALSAPPPSSHSPPGHTFPSHPPPPPSHENPTNGPSHQEVNSDYFAPVVLSNSPVPAQEISSERREEFSSEGESCKIPERNSDDLPTNCSSLTELKSYVSLSKPHGKSLPVHCIVEQIPGPQACGQHVELDSYAIVPSDTLFNDLVRTALGKLGYSTAQILGAKGCIQIKKWKPLAFDQITENPEATVADILGELTTVASLHVRLYSVPDDPQEWKDITVRNAVLELLREMSQSKLAKLCPLSQPMLSNIINNRYLGRIGKEKCQEFGMWYLNYRKQNPEGSTPEVVPSDRPADGRLTFHPVKELPLMRDWFHSCRSPSRRTLQLYVDILNQGPVRQQERPKVVLSTLKNWWKNEKQRERKHSRGDENIDDPTKKKKRKRSDTLKSTDNNKNESSDQSLSNSNADPHELKSNSFTLINHSENESDSEKEKTDKKDCESVALASDNSPIKKSKAPKVRQSNSITMINYETCEEANHMPKDFITSESNILHSKPQTESIYPKIHSVCSGDNNNSLFPFPDPQDLSVNSFSKMYCDNPIERTNVSEGHNSHLSSEEDVDVVDLSSNI